MTRQNTAMQTVTGDFLVRCFNSRRFLDALYTAASAGRDGYEGNFTLWKEYGNERTYFSDVSRGGTETTGSGDVLRKTDAPKNKVSMASETTYPLIDLHFHPADELPYILPSCYRDETDDGDLISINDNFNNIFPDIKTIRGICSADDDKNVEMLLIQQQRRTSEEYIRFLYRELMRELAGEFGHALDTQFVAHFLDRSGVYKSAAVYPRRNGFNEQDKRNISRFAFVPADESLQ